MFILKRSKLEGAIYKRICEGMGIVRGSWLVAAKIKHFVGVSKTLFMGYPHNTKWIH